MSFLNQPITWAHAIGFAIGWLAVDLVTAAF